MGLFNQQENIRKKAKIAVAALFKSLDTECETVWLLFTASFFTE